MKRLIERLKKTEHGFKHILETGDSLLSDKSLNHLEIAKKLLTEESYQARMLATYILGEHSTDKKALKLLTTEIVKDENWRVQEMLAKAIDRHCKTIGYENALPELKQWLRGKNSNLKRAVIEGLRIWTARPYFKENPEIAISLISEHRSDNSEYLRKSVGNALRDIKRKFPDLIQKEISSWDLEDSKIKFTQKLIVKGL